MEVALLDMDIFAYRCTVGTDDEPSPTVAILRTTGLVADTLRDLRVDAYKGFFSPKRENRIFKSSKV